MTGAATKLLQRSDIDMRTAMLQLVPIFPGVSEGGARAAVERAPNVGEVGEIARGVVEAQCALYERTGAEPPWIGYFAVEGASGEVQGSCSFVGPPQQGSVEIAYFTFPATKGRSWRRL